MITGQKCERTSISQIQFLTITDDLFFIILSKFAIYNVFLIK